MNLVEQAMTAHWGEKCDSYEQGCPVCDAWREYENLVTYGETLNKENQMTYLTEAQLHKAAQYLETREGGFANAIALAYYRADKDNQRILLNAFAPLFEQAYEKWADYDTNQSTKEN
jgi:hypothetical protein